ncbi:MAG: chromosomal replication initiator protein DnaA [Clostridia bacterium]|nr:chromosomal replication initiator protein DnaA [Clostridia bacterium]
MNLAKQTWQEVLHKLSSEVSPIAYDTWINPLEAIDVEEDKLILLVPTSTNREMINNMFRPVIVRILSAINPLLTDISMLLPEETAKMGEDLTERITAVKDEEEKSSASTGGMIINPRYTFDNFVVGECNRFATAAAKAVAEAPGESYNPLFIYGGSGLGKTHIMHAIGNYVRLNNPHLKVLYVSSERFVNELIASIRTKGDSTSDFRDKYRNVDVLMIDDIQFISKKAGMQVEMFHTFNDLYQAGKQIIFASDRPPKEIPDLEDRLRTRFEWGLIADVSSPDLETRIAILQKKAQILKCAVPFEVFNFMAQRIESNIREMESLLNKVVLMSKLYGKPVTVELAAEALKDYTKPTEEAIGAEDIIDATLKLYPNVTKEELLGKKRDKEIVEPRMICIYLIDEVLPLPLTAIGEIMGGRDHTTIRHSKTKIAEKIAKDEKIRQKVDDIRNMIYKN